MSKGLYKTSERSSTPCYNLRILFFYGVLLGCDMFVSSLGYGSSVSYLKVSKATSSRVVVMGVTHNTSMDKSL